MMLSDSFGLPKGAKNRQNAINWLRLVGSKEGQDTFNPSRAPSPPGWTPTPASTTPTASPP